MGYLQSCVFSLVCLLVFLSPGDALSQLRGSSEKVEIRTYVSQDAVPAGETVKAAVLLDIAEGWHVNAHRPTLDYLIGTEIFVKPHDALIIADIRYPLPDEYEFAFAGGEALLVYGGLAPVFIDIRVSSNLSPGNYEMAGNVRVQACDNNNCLAPSNIPFLIDLNVVSAGSSFSSTHQDIFAEYGSGRSSSEITVSSSPGNDIEAMFRERGMFLAFLALFFIGLALNLTPCVYPMLSVTVSIFGGQNDKNIFRVFFKALIYVLGIATMYSILGVLASFSGELFGSWLQHPWVLGGIGILLFALALSMFGLYEIQVPYWLASRIGTGTSSGLIGVYFSGLVVGIFAAPCIGPPIIALLAFIGSLGDPVFGFWSFFILSLGLGFPYLILGTFSGLLPKLPKSGVWMVWVKKVFGVVLVALALFYLAMPFIPASDAYWVIPVSLITGGIYLGFLESSGRGTKVFPKIKMAFGIFAIFLGVVFIMNLQKEGMTWVPFSEAKLEEAKNSGTPVVIDFYADWCIPCLELERITFTDPRVISATDHMARLKVDLTNFDSPESEQIRRKFNVAGVPTIILLDSNGDEIPGSRVVGFEGPDRFLARLKLIEN